MLGTFLIDSRSLSGSASRGSWRERLQGRRREVDSCRSGGQHLRCALLPLVQQFFPGGWGGGGGSCTGEFSLQHPRTCRTSLTTRSQGKTRISWGSPPPQDLSFSPKGSPPSFKTPTFQQFQPLPFVPPTLRVVAAPSSCFCVLPVSSGLFSSIFSY